VQQNVASAGQFRLSSVISRVADKLRNELTEKHLPMTLQNERHNSQPARSEQNGKPDALANAMLPGPSLRERVRQATRQIESEIIIEALERHRWNRRRTAEALRISYRSLMYKMKNCDLRGNAGQWKTEERYGG
jgi:DNA-binding NtrC family response regulator